MKFFEEFKLYESLWDSVSNNKKQSLKEWKDASGKKINVSSAAASSTTGQSANTATTQSANNLYVIFNYYRPNDLDDFCMLHADTDKSATVQALVDMAEQSVENFGRYKNTLVCFKIDPDEYDLTADDFIEASESKHDYCGEGLHYEYTDVVYALSHLAANETPLYKLDMPIVEIEFYDAFLRQNNKLGITIDDIYDANYNANIISRVYNDKDFQKFMKNKLAADISKAL